MRRIIAAVLLITTGGLIYVLFRSQHTILNEVIGDGWPWLLQWRAAAAEWLRQSGALGEFVVYSLPGGLWASSYILLIDAFYEASVPAVRLRWVSAVPLIGAASELLQACCPTDYMFCDIHIGRYDPIDLLCYLVPLALYLLYSKIHKAS